MHVFRHRLMAVLLALVLAAACLYLTPACAKKPIPGSQVPAKGEPVSAGEAREKEKREGLIEKSASTPTSAVVDKKAAHPSPEKPEPMAQPAGTQGLQTAERSQHSAEETEGRPQEWTVFYATDRNLTKRPRPYYANERDPQDSLRFGTCKVSIPPTHQVGGFESPSRKVLRMFRREREDPNKHVVFLGDALTVSEKADFLVKLRTRIAESTLRDAFIFVHGYNTTFENACRRTAQLAEDLKFTGAPIMYSWPSHGRKIAYLADEEDVVWSVPHFEEFLRMVEENTEVSTVHLIAHSLGTRLLIGGLASLARVSEPRPVFNQVVLAAPDIDAEVFRRLAEAVHTLAGRITLYASPNDKTLQRSRDFHRHPRLGESVVIVAGVDTVDASPIDTSPFFAVTGGHGYYAANPWVITDLIELLEGREPAKRTQLRERKRGSDSFYVFRRQRPP